MKSNIAFLFSNNLPLALNIAQEVCTEMDVEIYPVEEKATSMLNDNESLKKKVVKEFGSEAYKDGKFDPSIVQGLDFSTSPELTRLQNMMNDEIIKELNSIDKNVLVVSDEIIQTGLLHLSDNLIVAKFKTGKEYDNYISIDSIRDISAYYIEPEEVEVMTYTLRGCLVDCWNYS